MAGSTEGTDRQLNSAQTLKASTNTPARKVAFPRGNLGTDGGGCFLSGAKISSHLLLLSSFEAMAAYLLAVAILFCIQGWPSARVQGKVRPFLEVYQRSACQARETLVSLFEEYPDEISDIFRPSCVAVLRCGGCCTDESLRCTPVEERTVELQIMRVKLHTQSSKMEAMKFTEHTACECRPRSGSGVNIGKCKRSPEEGEQEPSSPLTPGAL